MGSSDVGGFLRVYDCGLTFARLRAVFVRQVVLACVLMSFAAFGPPAAAAGKIKHVLVIYASDRLLPANIEADIGIREALAESDPSAVVSAEFSTFRASMPKLIIAPS